MNIRVFTILVLIVACSSCETEPLFNPSVDWPPGRIVGGIVVYGDSRTGHRNHQWVADSIMSVAPVAVFHAGDLVEDGASQSDWDIFNDITDSLLSSINFYPTVGNHDEPEEPETLFFDQFNLPGNERWYSVSIYGVKFIVLDVVTADDFNDTSSEQFQWLESELQSAGADSTVAVMFHYPLYSTGSHGSDIELRNQLAPLFETHDVDLVLNGHDHNYERLLVNGIHYVITGGGGAPLQGQNSSADDTYSVVFEKTHHFCVIYRVSGTLMVDAWSKETELVDRFEISEP